MTSAEPLGHDMRTAGPVRLLVPALVLLVLTLGAMNIATVVSAPSHKLAFGLMERALLIFGANVAESLLKTSPTREVDQKVQKATAYLEAKNKQLGVQVVDAEARRVKAVAESEVHKAAHAKAMAEAEAHKTAHAKVSAELDDQIRKRGTDAKRAKEMATSVRARLATGVSRNVAAIPAEAVPYIGIGVNLSVTALDVYDACQTMRELNELMKLLGQGVENAEFCGVKVPTVSEVLAGMQTQWRASADWVAREAQKTRSIPVPEVRLPTASDAKAVVCPLIGSASWIAC